MTNRCLRSERRLPPPQDTGAELLLDARATRLGKVAYAARLAARRTRRLTLPIIASYDDSHHTPVRVKVGGDFHTRCLHRWSCPAWSFGAWRSRRGATARSAPVANLGAVDRNEGLVSIVRLAATNGVFLGAQTAGFLLGEFMSSSSDPLGKSKGGSQPIPASPGGPSKSSDDSPTGSPENGSVVDEFGLDCTPSVDTDSDVDDDDQDDPGRQAADLADTSIYHSFSLVAFLAWVGWGPTDCRAPVTVRPKHSRC